LLSALAKSRGDLPATGVTWSEADAFARFAGKRLPSYVEWEFAVRGGASYRAYSCSDGEVRPSVAALGPLPVEEGLDLTPHTGLRDLCGNVSEWTSTPAWFPDGKDAPRNAASHAAEWRPQFLDPRLRAGWDRAEQFWVVGGSWRTNRFHFFVVDRRRRELALDTIGFRCAASAEVVMRSMADARSRTRFEETTR
jgi:formylglycine-generating enzyme required for sulfatase activity